ncbi:hypothetical protein [Leucobacter sp. USHLN153]|uniref:hypothetical protein n=1 Tax=Leucobacter sp. USHLN153 TaxID=3081268 RepID=UPI003017314A
MKQKPGRASRASRSDEPRESAIASGWRVEGSADPAASDAAAVDPTLVSDAPAVAADAADGIVDGTGREADETTDDAATDPAVERQQLSNGALVALGVFGGLYLLYTWGWFIVAQAYSSVNSVTAAGSGAIGGVLQQIIFWAAPLAAPLWFFTALAFSKGGRTKRLTILLAVGAILLVPLPMLIARGA